jgi:hypothetical protein
VVDYDSDYQALMDRVGKKFQTTKPMVVSIPDTSKETFE